MKLLVSVGPLLAKRLVLVVAAEVSASDNVLGSSGSLLLDSTTAGSLVHLSNVRISFASRNRSHSFGLSGQAHGEEALVKPRSVDVPMVPERLMLTITERVTGGSLNT